MGTGSYSLHFIKNKEQQEVDFLISDEHRPILLVEAKLADVHPSPALIKFQNALNVPAIQLVDRAGGFRKLKNGDQTIMTEPACQWLAMLP